MPKWVTKSWLTSTSKTSSEDKGIDQSILKECLTAYYEKRGNVYKTLAGYGINEDEGKVYLDTVVDIDREARNGWKK